MLLIVHLLLIYLFYFWQLVSKSKFAWTWRYSIKYYLKYESKNKIIIIEKNIHTSSKSSLYLICLSVRIPTYMMSLSLSLYIYIYIYIYSSLSVISSDRSFRLHPVSAWSSYIYIFSSISVRIACDTRPIFYWELNKFEFRVFLFLDWLPYQDQRTQSALLFYPKLKGK